MVIRITTISCEGKLFSNSLSVINTTQDYKIDLLCVHDVVSCVLPFVSLDFCKFSKKYFHFQFHFENQTDGSYLVQNYIID